MHAVWQAITTLVRQIKTELSIYLLNFEQVKLLHDQPLTPPNLKLLIGTTDIGTGFTIV